ncbi:MAG: NlpC/p60-like transpeptidase [Deltaproteobacteria bacterium]|nr:NlpC/p60-like transpeptidase [Deltaproteobacteria bacterium]
MIPSFPHRQSAHCESGVTANLLTHHGIPLSEAMAFGIGSGLFFGYFPFVRINHLPLTTFRSAPGGIIRRVAKRLGVRVTFRTFRDAANGMAELDRLLAEGVPVGAQTGVYWLPYFPPALRFHFNAHNLVVFGKEGGSYRISDPVIEEPILCGADDLKRARFARGPLAPNGKLFFLTNVPKTVDPVPAIWEAIREVCRLMTRIPIPLIGVPGMRYLAGQVESWPSRLGERRALLYLGNVIRMQEEVGTGGGGFRFIYAAFLQEAAAVLDERRLLDFSQRMTAIGDLWRDFAVAGAHLCKGRPLENEDFPALARIVRACADAEHGFFRELDSLSRSSGRDGRS